MTATTNALGQLSTRHLLAVASIGALTLLARVVGMLLWVVLELASRGVSAVVELVERADAAISAKAGVSPVGGGAYVILTTPTGGGGR